MTPYLEHWCKGVEHGDEGRSHEEQLELAEHEAEELFEDHLAHAAHDVGSLGKADIEPKN